MTEQFPKAEHADIALLLEGTFPYVSGGVSSWVNQIIRGFPQYTFALVFLGSRREDYGDMKYTLPDNVVHVETYYLHDRSAPPLIKKYTGDRAAFQMSRHLHDYFHGHKTREEGSDLLSQVIPQLQEGCKLDRSQFLYSNESWEYIKEQYRDRSTDPSFVDYFWTVRAMHEPIWVLAEIAEKLIPARAYHTVSTGYAGFLGALLRRRHGKPLILSEHGIYTKERKIDLFQSEWIKDNRNVFQKDPTEISYFRELWIRFFTSLGRMCYDAADDIIALYEANRLRQIQDGADPARTSNVPNGVNVPRLAALRPKRPEKTPLVLGLIGRVVPIKDIKTFIRAMRTVANRLPDAEGWIVGPEDEDAGYAEECRSLVISLGLTQHVKFLGFQKIDDIMPQIGLVVLSSISEALPLVILEGYAAGVPTVATDVGSCKQLVYGLPGEDAALGASGAVVSIADPQALADAAIDLLNDQPRWQAAQTAAIQRVEKYYTQDLMFARYQQIYDRALGPGEHA